MPYMYKCIENPCKLSWIKVGQVYEAVDGTTIDGINFLRFKNIPGSFPAYNFELVPEKPLPAPKPPKDVRTYHLHNHSPYPAPDTWVMVLITGGILALIVLAAGIYRHFN